MKSTKRYRIRLNVAIALSIFSAVAHYYPIRSSARSPQGHESTAELTQWKKSLLQAGATQDEVKDFELFVQRPPDTGRSGKLDYIRNAPSSFFVSYLKNKRLSQREREREAVPAPLFSNMIPARSCESLRELSIAYITVDTVVEGAEDRSCRVTVTLARPASRNNRIRIFIALPITNWNGRLYGTGGAGYAGGSIQSLDARVAKGYVTVATDTGNESGTAAFALEPSGKPAWERIRNNAYLGIHEMTVIGKQIAQAFYGKAPRYAYFVGGSTGGRQALTEAQRYPQDYDAILALCPAIARDRYVPAQLWPQVVMREANNFISKGKREFATAEAVKACDGLDGVIDNVIADPMECHYDPAALVGDEVDGSTFTSSDAAIIRSIWDGPRGHDGRRLWWGPTPGTDLSATANTVGSPLAGKPSEEALDWFRYFLALDPKWDWKTLTRIEFELFFEQSIQMHAGTYGGDDPDLTGFRDRGGKLLIVHGLADQLVPPQATIDYYRRVQERMGGEQRVVEFARLFLAPGVDHSFVGPGPSPTGLLDVLIRWTEEGQAPQQLLAESLDGKGVTRPLYPYPRVAKYSGKGATEVADSFSSAHRISP